MSALSSNTKYYKEAFNLFKQCSKNDDRQDLANKVFEEAAASTSDTVKIVQACSRELEQFLPFLNSAEIIETLFERLTEDQLDELIRDRAGCFLFEKLLLRLPKFFSPDNERVRQAYERLFQCVCAHFDDYIKETGTSHIIAATIFFLHPLVEATHPNEYESLLDAGRTAKKFLELSADWGAIEKLKQIAKLVKKNTEYNEFVYATLLRTSGYLRPKLYGKLVDRLFKKYYSELSLGQLLNKNSSFVFEVLLEFPSEQRETLLYPLIVTDIEQLYLHPIGNFLLQNLLLTVQKKELLESIYRQLTAEERFDKLLQQGHIRLLITFIRMCERMHCHYEELVQRLKQSVQPESKEIHDFIPSVLKLRAGEFRGRSMECSYWLSYHVECSSRDHQRSVNNQRRLLGCSSTASCVEDRLVHSSLVSRADGQRIGLHRLSSQWFASSLSISSAIIALASTETQGFLRKTPAVLQRNRLW